MSAAQNRLQQACAPSGGSAIHTVFPKSGVATRVGAV